MPSEKTVKGYQRREVVYAYAPLSAYQIQVPVDGMVDVLLQPGEEVRDITPSGPEENSPWKVKEATSEAGDRLRAHVQLVAFEAGHKLVVSITTNRRVYYLELTSVPSKAQVSAVRWEYPPEPVTKAAIKPKTLWPNPTHPHTFDAGYTVESNMPNILWAQGLRVYDDGTQTFFLFPPQVLSSMAPLLSVYAPGTVARVNYGQRSSVYVADLVAPRWELRLGSGATAQVVTVTHTRSQPMTCPGDALCPQWPDVQTVEAR